MRLLDDLYVVLAVADLDGGEARGGDPLYYYTGYSIIKPDIVLPAGTPGTPPPAAAGRAPRAPRAPPAAPSHSPAG